MTEPKNEMPENIEIYIDRVGRKVVSGVTRWPQYTYTGYIRSDHHEAAVKDAYCAGATSARGARALAEQRDAGKVEVVTVEDVAVWIAESLVKNPRNIDYCEAGDIAAKDLMRIYPSGLKIVADKGEK